MKTDHETNVLYVIECFDDKERFIKVGTTKTTINRRFSGKKMPYHWRLISKVKCHYSHSLKVETLLGDELEQYEPLKKFGGYLECFKLSDLGLVSRLSTEMLCNLEGGL
jgi:hypothetical protein